MSTSTDGLRDKAKAAKEAREGYDTSNLTHFGKVFVRLTGAVGLSCTSQQLQEGLQKAYDEQQVPVFIRGYMDWSDEAVKGTPFETKDEKQAAAKEATILDMLRVLARMSSNSEMAEQIVAVTNGTSWKAPLIPRAAIKREGEVYGFNPKVGF